MAQKKSVTSAFQPDCEEENTAQLWGWQPSVNRPKTRQNIWFQSKRNWDQNSLSKPPSSSLSSSIWVVPSHVFQWFIWSIFKWLKRWSFYRFPWEIGPWSDRHSQDVFLMFSLQWFCFVRFNLITHSNSPLVGAEHSAPLLCAYTFTVGYGCL